MIAGLTFAVLTQMRPPADPAVLHPDVLEAKAWRVLNIVRRHANFENPLLGDLKGESPEVYRTTEARPESNSISLSLWKDLPNLTRARLFLCRFELSDGRMGSFTVPFHSMNPTRVYSVEEAKGRAVRLHKEFFPDRNAAIYRTYNFSKELNQVHVQFSNIVPGSKYRAESDTEYWIDLEVGIAVRGFFGKTYKVRRPNQTAVHEDVYLADIVAETAKIADWNSIDIRNWGPRYGRLLSYGSGFRELSAEMHQDLKDGYSVLLTRVTALDADSWDEREKRWGSAVYFVVDSLTGKIISVNDGRKLGLGAPLSPNSRYILRPGFKVEGSWRYGKAAGKLTPVKVTAFELAKTVYLYNSRQAIRFDFDANRGLLRYAGKVYRPDAKLLKQIQLP